MIGPTSHSTARSCSSVVSNAMLATKTNYSYHHYANIAHKNGCISILTRYSESSLRDDQDGIFRFPLSLGSKFSILALRQWAIVLVFFSKLANFQLFELNFLYIKFELITLPTQNQLNDEL